MGNVKRTRKDLGSGSRRSGGQAVVEFALVAPVMVLIVLGIAEFGFYYQAREAVRDGVRAAARQASLCRSENDPTPASVYTGIVGSSVSTPPTLSVNWAADNTTTDGTGAPTSSECVAGAAVIVSTTNKTYSFSVKLPVPGIAGGVGFSIPLGSLDQQAEAIIE